LLLAVTAFPPVFAAEALAPAAMTLALMIPVLLALQWCVWRRGGWRLIGPHCYYDLIRMSRKGRTTLFRTLFLVGVVTAIYYTYERHQSDTSPDLPGWIGGNLTRPPTVEWGNWASRRHALDPEEQRARLRERMARMNVDCVYVWFLLQNIAILILTPAYVGGAIAEERELGTLDMLLTTKLYSREIVLGKLAARVLHLGAYLLAGLPVFSMMLVWGGIDVPFLIAQWLNSAFLLFGAACVCLTVSAMPGVRATASVIASYAVVLPAGLWCMNAWSWALQDVFMYGAGLAEPGMLVLFTLTYGIPLPACLLLSIALLRSRGLPEPRHLGAPPQVVNHVGRPPDRAEPALQPMLAPGHADIDAQAWQPALPPVTDRALLWKECYTGGWSMFGRPEVLLIGGAFLCWGLFLVVTGTLMQPLDAGLPLFLAFFGRLLRCVYAICLSCYVIGVSFRAAATVVRERHGHTLDMLLTLPAARIEILRAKCFGTLFKGWPWLAILAGDLLIGLLIGTYHPLTVVHLVIAVSAVTLCVCTLGLCFSVIARSPTQASLLMACALAALIGLFAWNTPGLFFGFSTLTFGWWDEAAAVEVRAIDLGELCTFVLAVIVMLLIAAISWKTAAARFERMGRC
jgi:ABC-type transport system involved in multi-copper enzyme maturation permease subunit